MINAFDWIWSLLPLFLGGGLAVWIHGLQARIEQLELQLEEIMEKDS